MAEPKKPEADNTDPEKATATGKTRRVRAAEPKLLRNQQIRRLKQ